MIWKIEVDARAVKELKKLDHLTQKKIKRFLQKIECDQNPKRFGKELKGELSGIWRYRVGDYRILCRIEHHKLIVLVVAIGHRGKIYR